MLIFQEIQRLREQNDVRRQSLLQENKKNELLRDQKFADIEDQFEDEFRSYREKTMEIKNHFQKEFAHHLHSFFMTTRFQNFHMEN